MNRPSRSADRSPTLHELQVVGDVHHLRPTRLRQLGHRFLTGGQRADDRQPRGLSDRGEPLGLGLRSGFVFGHGANGG
jgi:hypothetical protein